MLLREGIIEKTTTFLMDQSINQGGEAVESINFWMSIFGLFRTFFEPF